MKTMPIAIPVFYHNDSTRSLSDLEIDFSYSSCDQRDVYFYSIDVVAPHPGDEEDQVYTKIVSGGESFISPLPPGDIISAIAIAHQIEDEEE
jgi:hypothetical protein